MDRARTRPRHTLERPTGLAQSVWSWNFCSTSWHAETLNTAVGCRGEYLQNAQTDAARALHGVPQRIEGGEVDALVNAKGIVQLGAGQPCTTGERS